MTDAALSEAALHPVTRLRDWLDHLARTNRLAVARPGAALEFGSYQAMIACVAAGTGFALVPRSLLSALRAGSDLRQHAVPARVRRNQTHLVWNGTPSTALLRLQALIEPGADQARAAA